MKIYLATDHAGFQLKEKIKSFLSKEGHYVEDFGAYKYEESDDYPDFISKAAEAVSKNPEDKAIILGASGQGEAIVANKFKGIKAAVYYGSQADDPYEIVMLSRLHNNANILSLGAKFLTEQQALEAVKIWLDTPFDGGPGGERHVRRINKIREIEDLTKR